MIGLIASNTVDLLGIGQPYDKHQTKDFPDQYDSDTELYNLLPSHRMAKQRNKPVIKTSDSIDVGPKCKAFIAFLVMMTLVGVVMLVSMAALGEFEDSTVSDFHPVLQPKRDPTEGVVLKRDNIELIRDYRLPSNVAPRIYTLSLNVDVENGKYFGNVTIDVLCKKKTGKIILHATGHDVTGARVTAPRENQEIPINAINRDPEKQFLIFHLSEKLKVGKVYKLSIDFEGNISDVAHGFFRISHKSIGGQKRFMAMTKFEPIYARTVFPCFDEPVMKAKFKISMTHNDKLRSVSNMPAVKSSFLPGKMKEVHFQRTPLMPPYLLSLVISDLERTSRVMKHGVKIYINSPPHHSSLVDFTSKMIERGINLLSTNLKIKYPLPKVDVILSPDTLRREGMCPGNGLGLIVLPVVNPKAPVQRFRFLQCMAEQLAKSWFEGTLGINWWTDHWLVKALAVIVSQHAVLKSLQPHVKLEEWFYMEYMQPALKRGQGIMAGVSMSDVLNTSKGIEERIGSVFAKKGPVLLHMLKWNVGTKVFYKGIQIFLKRHHSKAASVEDFLSSFAKISKTIRVSDFMRPWIHQPGYPLIRVGYSSKRQNGYAKQTRLSISKSRHQSTIWYVPLIVKLPAKKTKRLKMRKRIVSFHLPKHLTWLLANYRRSGFYRLYYAPSLRRKILVQLAHNPKVIPEVDRAALIDDAFSLASYGKIPYSAALNQTLYLRKEKSFVVWKIALEHFGNMVRLFHGKKTEHCVKKYLFGQALHMINTVSWINNGDLLQRISRPEILSFAAMVGDKKTIAEGRKLFRKIRLSKERHRLPWEIQALIFRIAAQSGDIKTLDPIVRLYRSRYHSDRMLALTTVAALRSTKNIQSFIDNHIGTTTISSDLPTILDVLSKRPGLQAFAWKIVTKHWPSLAKRPGSKYKLEEILGNLVHGSSDANTLKMAMLFLKDSDFGNAFIELLRYKIKQIDDQSSQIEQWIRSKLAGKCH